MFRHIVRQVRHQSTTADNSKFLEDVFNKLKTIKEISKEPTKAKPKTQPRHFKTRANKAANAGSNNRAAPGNAGNTRRNVNRRNNKRGPAEPAGKLNTISNYAKPTKTFSPELDSFVDSAASTVNQKFSRKSFQSRTNNRQKPQTRSRIDRVIQRARRGRLGQEDVAEAEFLNGSTDRGVYVPSKIDADTLVLSTPSVPYSHESRVLTALVELLREKNVDIEAIDKNSLLASIHGEAIDDIEFSAEEIEDKVNSIVLGKTEFFATKAKGLNADVVVNASNAWNAFTNGKDVRALVSPALVGEAPVSSIPKPFLE